MNVSIHSRWNNCLVWSTLLLVILIVKRTRNKVGRRAFWSTLACCYVNEEPTLYQLGSFCRRNTTNGLHLRVLSRLSPILPYVSQRSVMAATIFIAPASLLIFGLFVLSRLPSGQLYYNIQLQIRPGNFSELNYHAFLVNSAAANTFNLTKSSAILDRGKNSVYLHA